VKQLLFAVTFALASAAFAQEIGTEITPTTPTSGSTQQQQPQQQPQPDPQQRGGYVYKPKGAKEETASAPSFTGTKVSASSGDFGVRAGFGQALVIGLPTITGASALPTSSLGISFFAGDNFKLLVDLGFGLLIVNDVLWNVGLNLGFDYLFRSPGDALRPFFHLGAGFGIASVGGGLGINFGAQLGFGAEYFFNPSFSVNGRLLIAAPMALQGSNFLIGIFSFTPGVGATWYF
jgi:hypothetical protein